jgi:formylglycine-generating enzyme
MDSLGIRTSASGPTVVALLLLIGTAAPQTVLATVYRCTAADGTTTYSDTPCAVNAQVQQVTPPARSNAAKSPPASNPSREQQAQLVASALLAGNSSPTTSVDLNQRAKLLAPYFLKQLDPSNPNWSPNHPKWPGLAEIVASDVRSDLAQSLARRAEGDKELVRDFSARILDADLATVFAFLSTDEGKRYAEFQRRVEPLVQSGMQALARNDVAPSGSIPESVMKARQRVLALSSSSMFTQSQYEEAKRQNLDISGFAGHSILIAAIAQRRGAELDQIVSDYGRDIPSFVSFALSAAAKRAYAALTTASETQAKATLDAAKAFAESEQAKNLSHWRDIYQSTVAGPEKAAQAAAQARRAASPMPKPGTSFQDCPVCPVLVVVPGGTYDMGSPQGEEGRDERTAFGTNEGPVHRVTVPSFAIGKYEVTRGQFSAFTKETGYGGAKSGWPEFGFHQEDNHPVVGVNARDADAYVQWLAHKTGLPYRLPSEAEWEYAARAGTTTVRYWGNDISSICQYENVADVSAKRQWGADRKNFADCEDGFAYTAPVGSFKPNPFGLYDMLGNASEIVADCIQHTDYSHAPTDGSAWGSNCNDLASAGHMVRGGNWVYQLELTRAAARSFSQEGRDWSIGLRVARSLP